MRITEVRVLLADDRDTNDAIRAYVSVCLDDAFVVHGVRVIRARSGRWLVTMPSHRATHRCPDPDCRAKASVGSRFCPACGGPMPTVGPDARRDWDTCHPIHPDFRQELSDAVLAGYARAAAEAGIDDLPCVAGEGDGPAVVPRAVASPLGGRLVRFAGLGTEVRSHA